MRETYHCTFKNSLQLWLPDGGSRPQPSIYTQGCGQQQPQAGLSGDMRQGERLAHMQPLLTTCNAHGGQEQGTQVGMRQVTSFM
jgi:hypothetical protein